MVQLALALALAPAQFSQGPWDDDFIAWAPNGSELVYSHEETLHRWPDGATLALGTANTEFSLINPEYARWNRSRTQFVLGNCDDAGVVDWRTFRVVKRLPRTTCAWWSGDTLFAIRDFGDRGQLVWEGARKYRLPNWDRVLFSATTEDGRYWLASVGEPHRGYHNCAIYRYLGKGRLQRLGLAFASPIDMSDYAYGSFLTPGPRGGFLFGICGWTSGDKVSAYTYFWPGKGHADLDRAISFCQGPGQLVGVDFVGLRWRRPTVEASYVLIEFYRTDGKRTSYTPARDEVLYYAVNPQGTKEAVLIRMGDQAVLLVGRLGEFSGAR